MIKKLSRILYIYFTIHTLNSLNLILGAFWIFTFKHMNRPNC